MADARYLMLFGTLHGSHTLELIPGYLSERRMPHLVGITPPVDVQLMDDAGRVLITDTLFTAPYCSDGAETDDLLVRGAVPFRDDVRQIRFSYRGVDLVTMPVSRATPELRLLWQPRGTVRGRQTIGWESSHPDGLAMQYFLRYSTTAGRWERLTGRLTTTEHVIDFDQLAGGDQCRIAVVATDGVNTTVAQSDAFTVERKPDQVFLLEPADGDRFAAGQIILLRGQRVSLEDRQRQSGEALRWTSDRDGELGNGAVVELRDRLSPGPHAITVQLGEGERRNSQTITIYVEDAAARSP